MRRFGHVVDTGWMLRGGDDPPLLEAEHPYLALPATTTTTSIAKAWIAAARVFLDHPTASASIALLTYRVLQRRALQEAGVAVPRFSAVNEPVDDEEIDRLCREVDISARAVRFPTRYGDSAYFTRLPSVDELVRLIGEVPEPGGMILEERMESILSEGPLPYAGRLSTRQHRERTRRLSHYGITGLFAAWLSPFRSVLAGSFPADVAPEGDPLTVRFTRPRPSPPWGLESGCYRTVEIMPTPNGLRKSPRLTDVTQDSLDRGDQARLGVPVLELSMRLALGEHIVVGRAGRLAIRFSAATATSASPRCRRSECSRSTGWSSCTTYRGVASR